MKALFLAVALWTTTPVHSALYLEDLFTDRLVPIDFAGKHTVITFIQPACPYCEKQIQQLKCLRTKRGSEKLGILVVQSTGEVPPLRRSLSKAKLPFPVLKGEPAFLSRFGADRSATPFTVVIASDGSVKHSALGAQSCEYWVEQTQVPAQRTSP